jgi:hypothetical protein
LNYSAMREAPRGLEPPSVDVRPRSVDPVFGGEY